MRLVWGIVVSVETDTSEVQVLDVALDDGTTGTAISYPDLIGVCRIADRVLLNTTAVGLGLGTGGHHFIVARTEGEGGTVLDEPSGGHIMKMRYTPMQLDVECVEEQDSPHHQTMKGATTLAQMPVACCGLHSQVPLVAAAVKNVDPDLKIAYVMTDFAALPIALSNLVRASLSSGLLDTTITCGQAFGGRFEAVNMHSGMLAARHVAKADVAIVAIGPGVVGTATPFGHGGIAQGEAVNAVSALEGIPVVTLRVSFADERRRHHGVSHHTLTALTRIALSTAAVAVPSLPEEYGAVVDDSLDSAGVWERHVRVDSKAGFTSPPSMRGVEVKTMGRGLSEDPAFFAAAFAAGDVCARYARGEEDMPRP